MALLRMEVGMTLWKQDVTFVFNSLTDGGYMGQIVFPKKFSIGDIIRDLWKETMPDTDFPLGDIDLELESVMGVMKDTKDGKFSIVMFEVVIEGIKLSVYFIRDKEKAESTTVFGIAPQNLIKIEELPGVNKRLPSPIEAGISFLFATNDVSFDLSGKKLTFKKGFTADCSLNIPNTYNDTFSYTYNPEEKDKENQQSRGVQSRGVQPSKPTGETKKDAPSAIKWKKLDKKLFGFATLHRVGYLFKNKKLSLLLDMTVDFSVLQLSLLGLKLEVDLNYVKNLKYITYFRYLVIPKPTNEAADIDNKISLMKKALGFGLSGIGVGIETKTFTLAGLLTKEQFIVNNKEYDQYIGGLVIKTKSFSVGGLAAYGEIEGYKSFFFYAFLNARIGGPPYFTVMGLALGFGYNRQIIIPSIDKVAEFPLIKIVMGKPDKDSSTLGMITKMIPMISEAFPPKEKRYFFAVGVKFNSFKIIDGFVLLIVSIGGKLRIDILGLMVMSMPKDNPVAYIEIAIKVTLIPADGTLKVDGLITDNSYIFSENAKLQGGFAFYTWFKDIEENGTEVSAGDFVLTVGGYHPRYVKPAQYPDVPRFGISWRVSDKCSVKALAYFALTPHAVMAGAVLSAVYDAGKFGARFKIWADFLISWKPFYYDISIGVEMSIWYKSYSLSLGASLHIWGPEFSGKAKVKIGWGWFSVSKTVAFGDADNPQQPKISWNDFKKGFLPKPEETISLNITGGMIKKENDVIIINPKDFQMDLESVIPISTIDLFSHKQHNSDDAFGIYPMVATSANSSVYVQMYYNANKTPERTDEVEDYIDKEIEWKTKKMPAALWSNENSMGLNPKKSLVPALVGAIIKAKPPADGKPFNISVVPKFEILPIDNAWSWEENDTFTPDIPPFQDKTTFGLFEDKFTSETSDFSGFALRATPASVDL